MTAGVGSSAGPSAGPSAGEGEGAVVVGGVDGLVGRRKVAGDDVHRTCEGRDGARGCGCWCRQGGRCSVQTMVVVAVLELEVVVVVVLELGRGCECSMIGIG